MTSRNRIKTLREKAGLTQDDVASKLGCTRAAVSHWEQGKRPHVATLIALARILKTTASELLGE